MQLLDELKFNKLSDVTINARARVYNGPLHIKYGCSVGGDGIWKTVNGAEYSNIEKIKILDDQIYIFHNNVIKMNAFSYTIDNNTHQNEWTHNMYWNLSLQKLNIIGINMIFQDKSGEKAFSGNINC